ncbi:cyclin-D4-1-like [Bidens hawaiensis]|uniref:cyclin-D4-1-like n=1 Tax=Bidens hawaiensis TaxID=980011 RepID=UPI00404A06BA
MMSAVVNHRQDFVIDSLIAAEPRHSPLSDHLINRSVNGIHRQDSINWILNAHSYYRFQPLTAILSVNYFDRFLSSATFELNNGWEFQLLSVACLSLAAKMVESEVPLLLDLQVSDPRYVLEPKTIQRMELLVMEKLDWRLRSITPFDFIDYFVFNIPHSSTNDQRLHSICSDLIVKTIRGKSNQISSSNLDLVDFLGFRPSVIAAAAAISVAGVGAEIPESYYVKVNKEMVRSCHQLMEEYLVDTCPSVVHKVTKQWVSNEPLRTPSSPGGVLDATTCVSYDTCSSESIFGFSDNEGKEVKAIVHEEEP